MGTEALEIEWKEGMSVGIPAIDEDHKRFIALVNGFNKAVADRLPLPEIKQRLRDIMDDAEQHFAHEERLLKEWHYPDADDHALKHLQIKNTLQNVVGSFILNDTGNEWIVAGLKIKQVLTNHIMDEDALYADYYQKWKNGGQTPIPNNLKQTAAS